jgi:solute carrier family 39 (zinc transporter), member 1/2/3
MRTSAFSLNAPLTHSCRSRLSGLCIPQPWHSGAGVGIFHCQVFRIGCHRRDCLHSRKLGLRVILRENPNNTQLLAPANEALTSPCLSGPITEYTWTEGIALMTIFMLFLVEVLAMRFATFSHSPDSHEHDHAESGSDKLSAAPRGHSQVPGDDHLSHSRDHVDTEAERSPTPKRSRHEAEEFAAQMTAIFILEFGVIFHSIFIGLTLAVAGDEFNTLYVVLVFHQTFEGLGLGSRLAATPWPATRRWTPYIMGVAYAVSTPIAIAVGLGVRETYAPGSPTELITNGVFDSISAGILIYTALVELMAHEFMFSSYMRRASLKVVMSAFGMMCLGAGE